MRKTEIAATETLAKQRAEVFIVEVSSNMYQVVKDRNGKTGHFVDGATVARALNSGREVALKKENGEILYNFVMTLQKVKEEETLHREVL